MATYFEAMNDRDKVVIDDTITRLHVTKKGLLSDVASLSVATSLQTTGMASSSLIASNLRVYTLLLDDGEEFAGIRLTGQFSQYATIHKYQKGKEVTFYLLSLNRQTVNLETEASHVYVYVFGKKRVEASESCGLEVFDAEGNTIFQSINEYLDIKNVGVLNRPNYSSSGYYSSLNINIEDTVLISHGCPQDVSVLSGGAGVGMVLYSFTQNNGYYGVRQIIPLLTNTNTKNFNTIGILDGITYVIANIKNG